MTNFLFGISTTSNIWLPFPSMWTYFLAVFSVRNTSALANSGCCCMCVLVSGQSVLAYYAMPTAGSALSSTQYAYLTTPLLFPAPCRNSCHPKEKKGRGPEGLQGYRKDRVTPPTGPNPSVYCSYNGSQLQPPNPQSRSSKAQLALTTW